jgi:hypothetical protein
LRGREGEGGGWGKGPRAGVRKKKRQREERRAAAARFPRRPFRRATPAAGRPGRPPPTPQVRERFTLDGAPCANRRRDWRGGGTRGTAAAAAPDRLVVRLEFDDPHGGVNVDTFSMPSPDELVIDTVVTASSGEAAEFRQVYTRRP